MTRRWSCILTALYLLFKVHQYLPFNLALVRHPRFVYAVRAVGSSVVQTTRFTAVSHLPGFNWVLFTWQGTHQRGWWIHAADSGLALRCCFALCKHSITPFRPKCKLGENTRCWAFYRVKWVEIHNILWSKPKKLHFYKILHRVSKFLTLVFMQYAQKSRVARLCCAVRWGCGQYSHSLRELRCLARFASGW